MSLGAISATAAALALPMAPAPDFGIDREHIWAAPLAGFSGYVGSFANCAPSAAAPVPPISRSIDRFDLEVARNAIQALAALGDNWDGHGGVAPSTLTIAEATAFIRRLPEGVAVPAVEPSTDGEINLVWRSRVTYLEVGFDGDGIASYLAKSLDSGRREFADFPASDMPKTLTKHVPRVASAGLPV